MVGCSSSNRCHGFLRFRYLVALGLALAQGGVTRAGDVLPEGAIARLGKRPSIGGNIWCVAFAPDGKLLAYGDNGGAVRVWDCRLRKERLHLQGHQAAVHSVAFSPDGKLLATASRDRSIRLWEVASGRERALLEGHQRSVFSVAFAPDGQALASASDDRTIRLWDPATGKPGRTLRGHEKEVFSIAFSADGLTLASASRDASVRLWQVATGGERILQAEMGAWFGSVIYSPDGRTMATAGKSGIVHLWESATGTAIGQVPGQERLISALAFAPDNRLLAWAGGFDRTVHLWSLANEAEVRTLRGHDDMVAALAFSPDGTQLATGSADGTILLWEIQPRTLPIGPKPRNLSAADLDRLWHDLGSASGQVAAPVVWTLAAEPEKAITLLKARLRPARGVDKPIAQLLADLDSDRFAVREAASKELAQVGNLAERELARALAGNLAPEARRRVELLLRELEQRPQPLSAEELRQVRGIQVLELIGSREAALILEDLTRGAALARQTQEARAALVRRARRN